MSLVLMQSLRTAAVLEDCVHQLDLLGRSLTVQIMDQGPTPVQEEDRLTRMKKDCRFISQQMSILSSELEVKQSFSCLLLTVEMKDKKRNKKMINKQARLEQKKQMELRQKIHTKLDKLKKIDLVWKDLKDKSEKKAAEMKNAEEELRKKMLEEETRQDENWQTQQGETKQLENKLQEQLVLLQKQLEQEERANEGSVKFLEHQHKEVQQHLNNWQLQTKQMLRDKQKYFHSISCKRTLKIDGLLEMRRKFREMEHEAIEDRMEQEHLLQQEAEARAATKLQAWWRGYVVRRAFKAWRIAEDKKNKKKKVKKK